MAQVYNSEFNYRTQVIGCTPWKKLQTLYGFLEGRKRALALEQVTALKTQAKAEKLKWGQAGNMPLHECLELEAEILEANSSMDDFNHAISLCKAEVELLNRLIAECLLECEPTRIEGYTDDQMFEVNEPFEFTVNVMREIQSEMLANGRPSPAKLLNALSNPTSAAALNQLFPAEGEMRLLSHGEVAEALADNKALAQSMTKFLTI